MKCCVESTVTFTEDIMEKDIEPLDYAKLKNNP